MAMTSMMVQIMMILQAFLVSYTVAVWYTCMVTAKGMMHNSVKVMFAHTAVKSDRCIHVLMCETLDHSQSCAAGPLYITVEARSTSSDHGDKCRIMVESEWKNGIVWMI